MSIQGGLNLDRISVMIEALSKDDPRRFMLSTLKFKNHRGVKAIFELGKLKSELLDMARDPKAGDADVGPPPTPPKLLDTMTDDEKAEIQWDYTKKLNEWEFQKKAVRMKIPVSDLYTIEDYLEPFVDAIYASCSIKGDRFHALTKEISEPQGGGFFGLGKKAAQ